MLLCLEKVILQAACFGFAILGGVQRILNMVLDKQLVVGDIAHSRGLELDDHCAIFQPRPFNDCMILYVALLVQDGWRRWPPEVPSKCTSQ